MGLPGETSTADEAPNRVRVSVALAVVFYLALTWWLSWELNVWRDEMYSLHTTAGSIGHAVRQAIDFELQPPLYFALLAAWRKIDDSIFFARILSSLFGAGAIVAIAAAARRIVPRMHPGYAAALLATHPFHVWAGTEIRVYALVVFLSALLVLTFVDAYWVGPGRPRARVAFAAVALAALYTQYYLVVLLVAFGTALLVRRDRSPIFAFAIDAGVVGLCAVPLVLAIRAQLAEHGADLGQRLPLGVETIRRIVSRFEAYLFSFNEAIDKARWSHSTMRAARWAYRALLFTLAGIGLWHLRGRREVARRSMAGAWAVGAGIGAYAACMAMLFVIVGPMSVGERHTAGLLVPGLLAVTAVPAVAMARGAVHVWTTFLLASNLAASIFTQVVPLAKDCDFRHVAEVITRRETSDEPILVFPSEDVMPLSVYYHGRNRLVPLPGMPSYEEWDQSTFVIRSPDEIARLVESQAPASVGLWVHTNTYGPTWGPEKLEAFLAGAYREDARIPFERGVVLRHFVRQEPGSTSVATP